MPNALRGPVWGEGSPVGRTMLAPCVHRSHPDGVQRRVRRRPLPACDASTSSDIALRSPGRCDAELPCEEPMTHV